MSNSYFCPHCGKITAADKIPACASAELVSSTVAIMARAGFKARTSTSAYKPSRDGNMPRVHIARYGKKMLCGVVEDDNLAGDERLAQFFKTKKEWRCGRCAEIYQGMGYNIEELERRFN